MEMIINLKVCLLTDKILNKNKEALLQELSKNKTKMHLPSTPKQPKFPWVRPELSLEKTVCNTITGSHQLSGG